MDFFYGVNVRLSVVESTPGLSRAHSPNIIEFGHELRRSSLGSYQMNFRVISHHSRRYAILEPLPFFNEQHKIGLHSHEQPCGAGAIDVGIDQGLHFDALQTNVPA